jgi:hypothetical protein
MLVTKKSSKETKFCLSRSRQRKVAVHKRRMPIVRCICGSEILVVPDLKAMNLAIDNHVTIKHKTTPENSEVLTEFLAEQVLLIATKINLDSFE